MVSNTYVLSMLCAVNRYWKFRIDIWHICFGGLKLLCFCELNSSLQNNYNRNYAWRMHRHIFSRRPRFLAKPDKEMWEKIYRLRHPEQTFPVSFFYLKSPFMSFIPNFILIVQWTLDLRKILGVDKIFLKSRFLLISNTGEPLKVANKA